MKVVLVVTNHGDLGETGRQTGWYLPEVAHPYEVFQTSGVEVIFASPRGGVAPVDPSSVTGFSNDEICSRFLANETVQNSLKETIPLSNVQLDQNDILFFAGGHGTMFDFTEPSVAEVIVQAYEQYNAVIASVCHGPAALVNARLSSGKHLLEGASVCCFTNAEEEAINLTEAMPFLLETKLREFAESFIGADMWQEQVVVSGRIVTGQNPASATKTAVEALRLCQTQ